MFSASEGRDLPEPELMPRGDFLFLWEGLGRGSDSDQGLTCSKESSHSLALFRPVAQALVSVLLYDDDFYTTTKLLHFPGVSK